MVAFVPMLFLPGWLGKLMKDIPLVVIPPCFSSSSQSSSSPTISRFAALTRNTKLVGQITGKSFLGTGKFHQAFVPTVFGSLPEEPLPYLIGFLGSLCHNPWLDLWWTRSFHRGIPPVPSDYISVKVFMQDGVPASSTEKALEQIERARLEVVDFLSRESQNPFKHAMVTMGAQPFTGGPEFLQYCDGIQHGEISVELIKSKQKPDCTSNFRSMAGKNRPSSGYQAIVFVAALAGGSKTAIGVEISGQDLNRMTQAAQAIKERLGTYEGLFDISDTYAGGKRELKLKLKRKGGPWA